MSAAANLFSLNQAHANAAPVSTSAAFVLQKLDGKNSIALCRACIHKFTPIARKHNYVRADRWGVLGGRCDGCREHTMDQRMFLHESFVADHGGKTHSGQVYRPR